MTLSGLKTWHVALFAIAAGGVVGAGTAAIDAVLTPWQIGGFRPAGDRGSTTAPRVDVDETTHVFGTIGTGAKGRHAFMIRNTGAGPLTLTRGASSCSCTIGDLGGPDGADAPRVVPPGESAPVTVQWTGKGDGGPFRQQVTILTDDPRRPEVALVVTGTVVPTWKAVPAEFVLPRISASAADRISANVFTFGAVPPVVRAATIDGDDTDAHIGVSTGPLPDGSLATEPGATGGFRVEVELKPGLPRGRLRRTVTVTFDMEGEVTVHLPLAGVVAGDILVAGPAWDPDRQALVLGTVSAKVGVKTRLFITAKGDRATDVRPVVRHVEPQGLVVTVGEPRPAGGGGSRLIELAVEIPPGSSPANHLCSESGPPGTILLDTGHPDMPTLTIPVCVLIGP